MILQRWVFLLMMLLLVGAKTGAAANPDVKDGCQEKCGDVIVPYPFGFGEPGCAMNDNFLLYCNSTDDGHQELWFRESMPARNISLQNGTVTVEIGTSFYCYDQSGKQSKLFNQSITLGSGPFTFSDSRNILTAVGCDTLAMVSNEKLTFGAACISVCTGNVTMSKNNSCSGSGCCHTSIPEGLKTLDITIGSLDNHTGVFKFNPCGFAFLADIDSLDLSDWPLSRTPKLSDTSSVVIEWVAETETCEKARANASSYACGNNTDCSYSDNGQGYRCSCNAGFVGNPYREPGCQDIDECKDPEKYPCHGKCRNTDGDYECKCSLGMRGDGKTGCQGFAITTIIAVIGAIVSLVIICLLLCIIFRKKRKDKNFRENGGTVLKHQRVRIFSEAELTKATSNYDDGKKIGEGGFGSVYKGVLADGTVVAVKKSKGVDKSQMNEDFQHEICVVSQVNHKNVVKLLGLCLETKVPLLVYEFISNGTLFKHIHDNTSRTLASWSNRLRIASEAALALDYLHSLADPPVIHGDVKSVNILLDDNYTAKVADFGASVLISPGQTNILVTKIQGTFGYLDPEYLLTGNLTEKSDVYSFGVVLVELLTGENPNSNAKSGKKRSVIQYFNSALENNDLSRILGFQTADGAEMDEIEAVAELARRCLNSIGVNRPSMKEVSEELAKLKALNQKSWAQKNSDETEHLLGESSQSFLNNESPPMSQSQTVISIEIEKYTDSI
ncbi:wall-associated receptor kinase [Salix suchowensis]|nr:wall-associated receptor kinase [Salix suchowensis]